MPENKTEQEVLQGNSQFTSNLFKVLSNEDNLLFSPLSLHVVLSMIYQGAGGSTSEALASTLHIPEARIASEGYFEIMKRLNSLDNVTLLMANKVFVMDGTTLLEAFNSAITRSFLSEVQLVDFEQNEEAAKTINTWVEDQTRDKIKNLINADDLGALTRLVLVNAIYYKGNWKHKFDKEATRIKPFYLNNNDSVDVQMMYIRCDFRFNQYRNDLNSQILELSYSNEDLSMLIFLPHARDGIVDLEEKLANVNITDLTKKLGSITVEVSLPKFIIEQTINLKKPLTELGLGEIFDGSKANFQGMLEGGGQLCVSKIIQKTFIEVNEEGSEAAVATGSDTILVSAFGGPRPDPKFTADHPFIFHLIHKRTTSLFVGKIMNPFLPISPSTVQKLKSFSPVTSPIITKQKSKKCLLL